MPKHDKPGPCLDKKCSWCCDPIKVHRFFPDENIPTNKKGEKIWKERPGLLIPEEHIDTVRLKTFDCVNLDKGTGICKDYEGRPDICKNTSCVDPDSKESVDKQHAKHTSEKFIQIGLPKRR